MEQKLLLKRCFKCGAEKTYFDKRYNHEVWYNDKQGNIVCKKCWNKSWYVNNKEYHLNYQRLWRKKHPDYTNIENLERREYFKAYYIEHRERQLNYLSIWRLEHPDYFKVWHLEHRRSN